MTTDLDLQADFAAALAPADEFTPTPDADDDTPDRFIVDDDRKAVWSLRKLGEARQRITDIDALYEEELARLDAWRTRAMTEPKRSAEYFESMLVGYLMRLREDDPPGKQRASYPLPGGTIKVRRSTSVQIDDPAALLAWAQDVRPDLIEERVMSSAVKPILQKDGTGLAPVTADGEKVPGIHIENRLNTSVETT